MTVTPAAYPSLAPGQTAVASKWGCDNTTGDLDPGVGITYGTIGTSCAVTEWKIAPAANVQTIPNPLPVSIPTPLPVSIPGTVSVNAANPFPVLAPSPLAVSFPTPLPVREVSPQPIPTQTTTITAAASPTPSPSPTTTTPPTVIAGNWQPWFGGLSQMVLIAAAIMFAIGMVVTFSVRALRGR